jgi:nitrous oxidase accessory protein NosD
VTRAGIAIAAPTEHVTIRGNRVWDSQENKTQTHGVWVTEAGSCLAARVEDNDLAGNAMGGYRFDTTPRGGRWDFERWQTTT